MPFAMPFEQPCDPPQDSACRIRVVVPTPQVVAAAPSVALRKALLRKALWKALQKRLRRAVRIMALMSKMNE